MTALEPASHTGIELRFRSCPTNLAAVRGCIENLAAMHALLRSRSADAGYWMVNIARGIEQLDRIRFEAINPIFLIAATKPA